ncbi:MAG TPA: DUF2127 domain-containing protein [Pyrinomonadaceae bacterium]|jgi:uncharacterized membrane protein (DUF2068 family)|nr:DUF2127 domain-containing protein [Pyrinomonadaceae bacterium]
MRRKHQAKAQGRGDKLILLIAAFKLLKGLMLIALGIGALSLIHKDVAAVAERWINLLRVDPDNRHIQKLLLKLSLVDEHKLEEISAGTFIYAGLFLTEGGGLLFRKLWAEYLTIIITTSFIPLEVYELIEHFSITKIIVILINMAVVLYLIFRLRADKHWPFKSK